MPLVPAEPTETTEAPPAPPVPSVSSVSSLSPSRAADFLRCPLLFRFRTVDRLPEPVSTDALRGSLVHRVLERLFDLPAAERTPTAALALVEPAWADLLLEEPGLAELLDDPDATLDEEWWASCRERLATYFRLEDPARLEPADRELFVEAPLASGLVLRGIVDRLDVAADGALRIVDYKTGRAPREGFELSALFQLRFYALALWRTRGVVPRSLKLVYLGSEEVVAYEPDEADLRATERKVLAVWEAISLARDTGEWQPSPGRLCDWCPHHDLCPVFGGTPPPLPEPVDAAEAVEVTP